MTRDDRPHAVYRIFNSAGRLLYVGLTAQHAAPRLRAHQRLKSWWSTVARIDVEHHPDRRAAAQAELRAIRTEAPLHNVAGAPNLRNPTGPLAELPPDLEVLQELLARDLSKVDAEELVAGIRDAELAFAKSQEWSGRLVAEMKRRNVSWSQLVALTGLAQTTLTRRAKDYL